MIDIKEQPVLPQRLPAWLKRPVAYGANTAAVESLLTDASLHTVCREAKCPNRGECFSRGTATFLILGGVCTRSCAFCGVSHGTPDPLDTDEPHRVCEAIRTMKLHHAVITSVTRDDLPNGGAEQFADIICQVRAELPDVTIEVLVPDFCGNYAALDMVLNAGPHVFNHNIETVPRLYSTIRPQASYRQSLEILAKASRFTVPLHVKSGIMVGLGETQDEVIQTLDDMRKHGCSFLTIGQYLRPSQSQTPVVEFVKPEQFEIYRDRACAMGFLDVQAGPFVRSSYKAETMLHH